MINTNFHSVHLTHSSLRNAVENIVIYILSNNRFDVIKIAKCICDNDNNIYFFALELDAQSQALCIVPFATTTVHIAPGKMCQTCNHYLVPTRQTVDLRSVCQPQSAVIKVNNCPSSVTAKMVLEYFLVRNNLSKNSKVKKGKTQKVNFKFDMDLTITRCEMWGLLINIVPSPVLLLFLFRLPIVKLYNVSWIDDQGNLLSLT